MLERQNRREKLERQEKRLRKNKSLRKTIALETQKARVEYERGLSRIDTTSGPCSSVWLSLFMFTGNVFAFAMAIQAAKAEQNANPHYHTRDRVNGYKTAKGRNHYNITDEEIQKKVTLDPGLKSGLTLKACQQSVVELVRSTLTKMPFSREYLPRVIKQRDFTFECTSRERVNKVIAGQETKGNFVGFFKGGGKKNTIYVTPLATPSIMAHEGWHGRQDQLHNKDSSCPLESDLTIYPFFPINTAQYERLVLSLDKIETKARECKQLLDIPEKDLNNKQKKQLAKYRKAVVDLTIETLVAPNPELLERYNYWLRTKNEDSLIARIGASNYEVKIVKLLEEDGEKYFLTEHVDPLVGWMDHMLTKINWLTQIYRNQTPTQLIRERDAYVIQFASREALLAFDGKDYLDMLDEHRQRCLPHEPPPCADDEQEEFHEDRFRMGF